MSIKIRAIPKEGFYRCGRHFTPAFQPFPEDTFTPEELEILEAEPMLEVQPVNDNAVSEQYLKDKENGSTDESSGDPVPAALKKKVGPKKKAVKARENEGDKG